jgi:2-keto-4-pentenoate hydratase/2-oxohepta-3-ene-1,7-dioic acid hydratase in catechol pathway
VLRDDAGQDRLRQWTRGKSLDTFCPIGPRVVPRQATADVIFTVAELVAFVSETITLVPGDLIATGTPPGVALGRSDPRYLEPGETVEVEIEGIGVLRNLIVAG